MAAFWILPLPAWSEQRHVTSDEWGLDWKWAEINLFLPFKASPPSLKEQLPKDEE